MLFLIALSLLIVIALALLWTLQRRLMYFPDRALPAPRDVGLPDAEPVTFTTADNVTLHGWLLPAARAAGPTPARPRFTAIVFNGNAGNRAYRAPLAAALRARGIAVLLFDYRGFGDSTGAPSESGLAQDARAARAFLLRSAQPTDSRSARDNDTTSRPIRPIDQTRLIYFGESLGAAVALDLATEHPPAALILRSPFTSMTEMGQLVYPFLPVHRLLRDRYPSFDRITQLRCPLLVIAGDADRIVPITQSRRLFDAAPEPKQLLVLPGVDHNDAAFLDGRAMLDALTQFLDSLPGSS